MKQVNGKAEPPAPAVTAQNIQSADELQYKGDYGKKTSKVGPKPEKNKEKTTKKETAKKEPPKKETSKKESKKSLKKKKVFLLGKRHDTSLLS